MIGMRGVGRRAGWICAVALCALSVVATTMPDPVWARDDSLPDVFVDGLYGGLIGAVLGTAAMALTSHPNDHLGYIVTGAAVGAIAGTVYGLSMVATHSMVEVDRGRVTWNVPSLGWTAPAAYGHIGPPTYSAALFRIRFE